MAFLDIIGVTKRFGSVKVLHEIDIEVDEGEFLVLVGPSGCGKSTLLNMIAGLESVSSGEIRIRDSRINEVPPSQRDIAMVFQSYALYPNMTVAGNMAFGLEMHGVSKSERQALVAEVAELLQITPLLKRKPSQLSGGQRQRVAMGRALVRNPDVFLFDEPLSNLDAKLRVDMRTEIKKLHLNLGTTTVYVTHDQIEAMTLSTRIAVMKDGRLQQIGTPGEIYQLPSNLFVAGFMGSPPMNLIPAKLIKGKAGLALQISLHNHELTTLDLYQPSPELLEQVGREVILGLRPESITDPDSADRHSPANQSLVNRIIITETAGSDTFVKTVLGGIEITARMRGDSEVKANSDTSLVVNMSKAVLFDPQSEQRIP
jgi:multiple sugar transport system ATP-binding protein